MMVPLFFSLGNLLPLMIIPNADARIDGRMPFSKTYSIFRDVALSDPRQSHAKEELLPLQLIADPDYFGYLGLKRYNGLFTYVLDGRRQLTADEVAQLIVKIKA
jgi:hypothetical protein